MIQENSNSSTTIFLLQLQRGWGSFSFNVESSSVSLNVYDNTTTKVIHQLKLDWYYDNLPRMKEQTINLH